MPYKVAIRNNATGEVRLCGYDLEWQDHSEYWHTDGNEGCDCNAKHAFDGDRLCQSDNPCGHTAYSILYAILPSGESVPLEEEMVTA